MEISEFITDDKIKGTQYMQIGDDYIIKYIVLNDFYGVYIQMDIDTYDKYKTNIDQIYKSIKINK